MLQFLYSQIALSRRRYYASRPGARRKLAAPVISVGNLTVGGSGKTPIAAEIARLLIALGERPAILSRGYARNAPTDGVVIVSDASGIRAGVDHAGDEPLVLARAVPGAAVLVHPDRFVAGRIAESRLGRSVHVLDDGFQHFRLARDVDVLVADPQDFADTRTLPFGRFREPIASAQAADVLLVNAADAETIRQFAVLLRVPTAFGFSRAVPAPVDARTPVFAFAGIAKPERFFEELKRAGWSVAGSRAFRDHHAYTDGDLRAIAKESRDVGAGAVVTTEKDGVRLNAAARELMAPLPLVEVPLAISIDPEFSTWLAARLARARAA